MKKILCVFLLLVLAGCASVSIPHYIQDKYPYKRTFYAQFNEVREIVMRAFERSGWAIEKESEPALFERESGLRSGGKETLFFSKIRQTSLFVGTRFSRVNAYVRASSDNETEVEIRYVTVTSAAFKNFNDYKNDRAVERIFKYIEERLNL